MCDPHRTCGGDEKCGFLGLSSKLLAMVCQRFGLKTIVTISWFGPQNQVRQFGDLSLKITMMISWFGPQNQAEEVCRFVPQN
jgi:hypothetical protein